MGYVCEALRNGVWWKFIQHWKFPQGHWGNAVTGGRIPLKFLCSEAVEV